MALGDRIKESTTTTGTGTYNLDGTVTTFQTFISGIETGGVLSPRVYTDVPYTCLQSDASGNNIDIEIGRGTLTAGTGSNKDTLSRDSIVFSSNGNSEVDWGAGTKTIVCAPQAFDVGSFPHFELTKSADQTSISSATYVKITWDGTASSAGCTVDLPNNEVDITESGDYVVSIQIGSSGATASTSRLALYTDGTIEGDYASVELNDSGAKNNFGVTEKYTLTAPVTISAYVYSGDSITIPTAAVNNNHPICKFSAFKIPGT